MPRLGGELGPGLGAERFEHVLVIVERVAGEEEADRLELAGQAIGRHEGLGGAQLDWRRNVRGAGEEIFLTFRARLDRAVSRGDQPVDIGKRGGAVDAKLIERAGSRQCLERTLVQEPRIDAAGEIGHIAERPPRLALGAKVLDRVAADILHRGQRIANGAVARHEADL